MLFTKYSEKMCPLNIIQCIKKCDCCGFCPLSSSGWTGGGEKRSLLRQQLPQEGDGTAVLGGLQDSAGQSHRCFCWQEAFEEGWAGALFVSLRGSCSWSLIFWHGSISWLEHVKGIDLCHLLQVGWERIRGQHWLKLRDCYQFVVERKVRCRARK